MQKICLVFYHLKWSLAVLYVCVTITLSYIPASWFSSCWRSSSPSLASCWEYPVVVVSSTVSSACKPGAFRTETTYHVTHSGTCYTRLLLPENRNNALALYVRMAQWPQRWYWTLTVCGEYYDIRAHWCQFDSSVLAKFDMQKYGSKKIPTALSKVHFM